jgi:hypothetical protein
MEKSSYAQIYKEENGKMWKEEEKDVRRVLATLLWICLSFV